MNPDVPADASQSASPETSVSALPQDGPRWQQLWSNWPSITSALVAVVAQPSYEVEYLNPAGRALLGLDKDLVLQERTLMEFMANQCLWTLLNDATPTAWRVGSWTGEIDLRRSNGDEFPALATVTVLRATKGFPDTLVIVARDISETRRSVLALKRDQRYLRALIENVPDIIYFKDLESRLVRVNYSYSRRCGVADPEMLVGKTDFDLFTAEHAQAAYDAEQEIIRTGRPVLNLEEKETWPDGRITWVATNKMPFYNEYGQVVGTFGVTRDITARKHTEAALAESQRRLIEASRLAGMAEVASGVLHNVGNAFNSVNTSASLIGDHLRVSRLGNLAKVVQMLEEHSADLVQFLTEDARGRQLPVYLKQLASQLVNERDSLVGELETLRKGIEHIKAVIAMQQSYAHASSLLEDLSLAELLDEALLISASSLTKNRVNIVRDFAPTAPVHAARHRVLEILVNLIRNAEQAMADVPENERRIAFIIRPSDESRVRLSVRDNGVGIPKENLHRIFSFGFTTKRKGHGFGLHNSALAAKEMNGVLQAFSEGPGKGAEFVLVLPTSQTVDTTAPIPLPQ
ncbi:histidine kinase [Opitutaceae bacterium EW11]|nr:histidine kinase [Opitutaceae bacterium EW11]